MLSSIDSKLNFIKESQLIRSYIKLLWQENFIKLYEIINLLVVNDLQEFLLEVCEKISVHPSSIIIHKLSFIIFCAIIILVLIYV